MRVQLVDEGDDLALGVGDLLEHRLQALLELAAVLGPGHHGAQVERDHALALEALGHVALDDPVGQPLDDGRLADAGLADQDRVVLGPARQHLNHPADLLVAPDDRVELALAGRLGEVAPVLGQGLVGLLGVRRRHAVVPPHGAQRGQQRVPGDADLVGQRQHEMLHRDVVVAQVAPVLVRRLQDLAGVTRQPGLRAPLGPRQPRQLLVHLAGQHVGVDPDLGQQRARHGLVLLQQRVEQVGRRQLRVVGGRGVSGRRAEGGLRVVGPAFGVYRHRPVLLSSSFVVVSSFGFVVIAPSRCGAGTAPAPGAPAPGRAGTGGAWRPRRRAPGPAPRPAPPAAGPAPPRARAPGAPPRG